MRYYNYLNENSYEDKIKLRDSIKNNKIVEFYLKSKNYYLFRGIEKKIDKYEYFNRRTDRQPRDMPIEIHNKLDKAFNKKFGWKARSHGVFVAGDYSEAKYYGNPYLFIPIDPFEYIYSPKIKDLYAYIENEGYAVNDKTTEKELTDEIINIIVNGYKKNADLYEIILNKAEVMFNCNKFILMDMYYFQSLWSN